MSTTELTPWSFPDLAVNVRRTDDAIVVDADLPGLKPEDVKITVEDGVLTISGEHEESSESKDEGGIHRERRYGAFTRTMPLPGGARADAIKAEAKDGGVAITVPLGEAAS